ncbi:LysR family transcriptional regulator [Actinomadura livida]|uniref:DNA-binding transcriptional LysR family regulator n=1 Tax=Actinomadura livida TaxID=79909 RepID=A0A7W7N0T1_9ACTN|nr:MULTISPECIES: LysR family transcriptional regulator [Actinomadura]MBB4778356.1 DNA-binding transcriptional LysR family regulator [Actinomadura catellatispora]GGU25071.1 LysR family transcriptional regulator [Actinomadura livida]
MLDLERLRALHSVATYGSVSAAADVLHVTTSAVSQQLAKLERETGQKLLERNGRGVRLTDAAELLVAHAERILSLVEQAQADLEAHRGSVVGQLTVAAFPTAVRGLMPAALGILRADHPDLRILVREEDPNQSMPLVSRGDFDMAVVQDWNNEPLPLPEGLCKGVICDDVADVALPAGHPLAGRDAIDLKELAGDPWISSSPDSICCDWLLRTLRAVDSEPRIEHMVYEFASQLSLVAAGFGNVILPRLGRCDVPPGVAVVPLADPLSRRVYALWREEAARRPAIRAVVGALRAAVPPGIPVFTDASA